MNTPNFITLPSGLRVNTAHIILVRRHPDAERVVQISIVGGDKWMEEVISLEEWDALLQPQQSPIVSPVVNLDNLKPGSACQFTFGGEVRHGIIDMINPEHDNEFVLVSRGEKFFLDPITGRIED